MKWFSLVVTCLLTVALLSGGVGCTKGEKKTVEGEGGKKLTLKAPGNTTVKQGDTAAISVDITREKFNDPVELKITGLPEGVSIMEDNMTISKDATSTKLTLKAAADAKPVDDHPVTVTATSGGLKQDATFKVTVKKKA
jgi:uncharacterized membrane protein